MVVVCVCACARDGIACWWLCPCLTEKLTCGARRPQLSRRTLVGRLVSSRHSISVFRIFFGWGDSVIFTNLQSMLLFLLLTVRSRYTFFCEV